MGSYIWILIYIVVSGTIIISEEKQIHLNVICDNLLFNKCAKEVNKYDKIHQTSNPSSVKLSWEIKKGTDDLFVNYQLFNVTNNFWNIFLVFGDDVTTNAAEAVAVSYHLPIILYDISHWKNTIFSSDVVTLHGDPWTLGQATSTIVESHYLPKTCFIIDDKHLNDQFLEGFIYKTDGYQINDTQLVIFRDEEDLATLSLKLSIIKEQGFRLIIAHIPSFKIKRIFEVSENQGYFDPGYAWILSEISMPASDTEEHFYPSGLLGLESREIDGIGTLIEKSLKSLFSFVEETGSINGDFSISDSTTFRDQVFRYVTSQRLNDSSNDGLSFDEMGRRTNISYVVRNKEFNKAENTTQWKDIGYVGSQVFTLNTIYWPGYTIFGPVENVSPMYRVVTRPAEPFVFIHGPVDGPVNCFSSFPCCLVSQTEPIAKSAFIDTCLQNASSNVVYCCSGIAIEMLDVLSKDLKFDYRIYFENDTDYGTLVNDTMTGMVGDIISGVADMIVGAFSITSSRSKFITYTEPFYFSGYSLVIREETSSPAIDAFLKPFDDAVWLFVIFSAIGTGIATALLEWNSPFGLNPWARKRAKNYTLGSGLTMVFSLWFGHTVSTKTPKGWPSKVLQNVWAAMAIFIVASYTANLAAYLAGNVMETQITGIKDNQLSSKRIALLESSSVADFIAKIDTNINEPVYVSGLDDAVQGLRDMKYDVYVDDTPILEYKLAQLDSKCTIRFSGQEFGENFYAFGLPPNSMWLEDKLSTRILDYVETGYLVTITKKFVSKRDCKDTMSINSFTPYDLNQTGGLFIMLVCGVALSVSLLFLEHAAFKYLVPYLRKQAADSRWKSRRTLEFFNQRLYRTVMSETLVSPQQTAREMMRIMKDRQFARMFQKNELKEQQKAVQRAHPKGLKFMNLTDILLRSHSDEQSTVCNGDTAVFSTSSSAKLYNISEEGEINNGGVKFTIESQDGDDSFFNESSDGTIPEEVTDTAVSRQNNITSFHTNNSDTNLDKMHLRVNHLWDQKLQLEPSEYISASAEMEVIKKKRLHFSHSDTSYITRRQYSGGNIERCDKISHSNETESNPATQSEPPLTTPEAASAAIIPHPPKSKSYYSSSVKLKDNRVKSTIRRHALAQFKRHSTSVFDECAVEALSKEDLLVLWKRSEIELQTKLNKLQSQNNHLKCLLSLADSDEDQTRKGSKKKPKLLCTKL